MNVYMIDVYSAPGMCQNRHIDKAIGPERDQQDH